MTHPVEAPRPLPRLFDWNRPFFAAGLQGRFVLQRCAACGRLMHYPRIACTGCLGSAFTWAAHPGTGRIYSFSVVWRPQHPAFNDKVPIVLVAVVLDAAPMMIADLVNCPPEKVAIGMPVRVRFERVSDEIALPHFEPAP